MEIFEPRVLSALEEMGPLVHRAKRDTNLEKEKNWLLMHINLDCSLEKNEKESDRKIEDTKIVPFFSLV